MRRQVMLDREWPRSRFWLCHFLYSRHQRPTIHWNAEQDIDPSLFNTTAHWLTWQTQINQPSRQRLLDWGVNQCAGDPAYIQSLRLFVREEQHQQSIVQQWLTSHNASSTARPLFRPALRALLKPLGLRFELSLLLLSEIATLTMNRMIAERINHPTLHSLLTQISLDQENHIAFHSERLTAEFADFNFIRRNLRRWRLRSMHETLSNAIIWRHRKLLNTLEITKAEFHKAATDNFNTVLERMVPYQRDTLIAALLQQAEQPYEKPSPV